MRPDDREEQMSDAEDERLWQEEYRERGEVDVVDWDSMGQRIIDAVGLPLIESSPRWLARDSIASVKFALASASEKMRSVKKREVEQRRRAEQIKCLADQLREAAIKFADDYLNENGRFLVDEIVAPSEKADRLITYLNFRGEAPANRSFAETLRSCLARDFEEYFGQKPTYTYSEAKGYPGPFWAYFRAVRDESGIPLKEEAIRKAYSRSNKRKGAPRRDNKSTA